MIRRLRTGRILLIALSASARAWAQAGPAAPEDPPRQLHYVVEPRAADEPAPSKDAGALRGRDLRAKIPIVAYAYTATGSEPGAAGAQAYGLSLVAKGQDSTIGGGGRVWWSPVERLTLIADAERNVWGNFSPALAGVVHLLGDPKHGFSFGGLGKFKVDGFAAGPDHDEIESELELGALLSFAGSGLHLDVNAVGGRGLGDDGETDTEGRLRFGYDIGKLVRLGVDGQARIRIDGPKYLPNGKIWDFAAGPQVFVGSDAFYGALTAGPATMGLTNAAVGFSTALAVGGTT